MENPEKKSTEEVCAEIRRSMAVEDARKALRWNVIWLAVVSIMFVCFLAMDNNKDWLQWTMFSCFFINPVVGIFKARRTLRGKKPL